MTRILIRLFIKNREEVGQDEVRVAYGTLAGIVGVIVNFLLFCAKLGVGLWAGSISIMADAVNNLSDAGSSVISFVGMRIAGKPADKEHPFGHGRMEYVGALIVSFIILMAGFSLFKESFLKVLSPSGVYVDNRMIYVLLASILIKGWLSLFYKSIGNTISSDVLRATAVDSRNDMVVTGVTILAILTEKWIDRPVDGWFGMAVSVFVILAGLNLLKSTMEPLLGQPVDPAVYEAITRKVESYGGIVGSHDLIVHNYGPTRKMATIHAEVPSDANMEVCHDIIDGIEKDVFREMGIFLVIHMDPVELNNARRNETLELLKTSLEKIDPKVSVHDFRMVAGEHAIKLIFDMVIPYGYSAEKIKSITDTLTREMDQQDQRYELVVTTENSFIGQRQKDV